MNWLSNFFMQVYWFLISIPNAIMMGDRIWARLRFLGVVIVFLGFITLGGLIFEQDAIDQTVINWLQVAPKLEVIPRFSLMLVAVPFYIRKPAICDSPTRCTGGCAVLGGTIHPGYLRAEKLPVGLQATWLPHCSVLIIPAC